MLSICGPTQPIGQFYINIGQVMPAEFPPETIAGAIYWFLKKIWG